MRAGNRSDLAVKLADRAARGATCSGDGGVGPGCVAIKRQDAIAEIFVQQALDRGSKRVAPLARGKGGHAVPEFSFADRGEVDLRAVLRRQPSLDLPGGLWLQEFREDVGVEISVNCADSTA